MKPYIFVTILFLNNQSARHLLVSIGIKGLRFHFSNPESVLLCY